MARLYPVQAIVTKTTTERIDLSVEASSEAEALAKARKVLEKFPRPHRESDVPYCWVSGKHVERNIISDLYLNYPEASNSA